MNHAQPMHRSAIGSTTVEMPLGIGGVLAATSIPSRISSTLNLPAEGFSWFDS